MNKEKFKSNRNDKEKVAPHVVKKGQFDYISWAACHNMSKETFDEFNWKMEPNPQGDLKWGTEGAYFVKIVMTVDDKTEEHFYPITDDNYNAIKTPTAWDINNAQMRGFAKLFSMMTGFGMGIYLGEDLKQYETINKKQSVNNTPTNNTPTNNTPTNNTPTNNTPVNGNKKQLIQQIQWGKGNTTWNKDTPHKETEETVKGNTKISNEITVKENTKLEDLMKDAKENKNKK